jgi:hypothetical protein
MLRSIQRLGPKSFTTRSTTIAFQGKLEKKSCGIIIHSNKTTRTRIKMMMPNTNHNNDNKDRLMDVQRTSYVNFSTTAPEQGEVDDNVDEEPSTSREDRWDYMLQQLVAYREEHGDTLVPIEYDINPQLGTWVDNQRQHYRNQKEGKHTSMDEDRIKKLEKEGFIWDVHSLHWDKNYDALIAYRDKFGDCNVPKNKENYESLWLWVFTQRRQYSNKKCGKQSSITDERIKALDDIGFIWSIFEETWSQRYYELISYKKYHGDCMVPSAFSSNPQLAKWVDMQRTQYRHLRLGKPSLLTDERISSLEEIGFVWNVYDFKWNQRYEELEDFVEINGHCDVPHKAKSLYRWCSRQRAAYRKLLDGKKTGLTDYRIKKLKEIGLIQ